MSGKPARLFTFASGGWVLALALAIGVAAVAWNLAPLWRPGRVPPRGDGRDAASYGFDLATSLVPPGSIVASGFPVDGLPALVDPKTVAIADLPSGEPRMRYLVGDDKVIGVVLSGEARAYPLRVLAWHEVVNDTVGGVPIAVTYNPLSHGIAVFDRRVGKEALVFGVSGLLYESGLLLYDRRPGPRDESLWSQLQARAIAGPAAAAGRTLEILPVALARWDAWSRDWPATRVLAPIPGEEEKTARDAYATYAQGETLRFPVDPVPPAGRFPLKTPLFVDMSDAAPKLVPLTPAPGERRLEVVSPSGTRPVRGVYAFWFAWYATHPG